MKAITDGYKKKMLLATKGYCAVILAAGPRINDPAVDKIIWEHGRRNLALREEGLLPIVCPVNDGSDVKGMASSTPVLMKPKR